MLSKRFEWFYRLGCKLADADKKDLEKGEKCLSVNEKNPGGEQAQVLTKDVFCKRADL